jgi:hypothetical protein
MTQGGPLSHGVSRANIGAGCTGFFRIGTRQYVDAGPIDLVTSSKVTESESPAYKK